MSRTTAAALIYLLSVGSPFVVAETRSGKPVIALASLGAPAADVEAIVPAVREAFGADVVTAPPVALPPSALDPRRGQYLSTALLDLLARTKRLEWERLLGVADVDLYVPELNFVFGEGDSRRGVAVFSMVRLGSTDRALFLRRSATEAIHELGHTYGLAHCQNPHCVMWFSNTLAESDRKGTSFCSIHAAQLAQARAAAAHR